MAAGGDTAGKSCPFCGRLIQPNAAVVACPACKTPHHAECWQKKGGCSAFGCRGTATSAAPQPTQQIPQSGSCPKCGYVYGPMETSCRRCAAEVAPPTSQYPRPPYKSRSKSPVAIIILCILLVLALGGAVSYLVISAGEGDIKFAYKFNPGQVNRYKLSMDMKMETPQPMFEVMPKSMEMKMTALMSEKVLEVMEDGSAKVETKMTDINVTSPDLPLGTMPAMPDQTVVATISKSGRPLDIGEASSSSSSLAMPGMDFASMNQMGTSTILPARGVDIGQTWTDTIPIPGTDGEIKVTSTLVSDNEMIGARKVCKIDQKYEGRLDMADMGGAAPMKAMGGSGEITISGNGATYFSQDEGRLIKTDGKIKMEIKIELGKQAASAGFPSIMEITMDMDILQELTD